MPPDDQPQLENVTKTSPPAWRGSVASNSRLKTLVTKAKAILKIRPQTLKESLEEAIEEQEAAGGGLDPEEKEMLHNVLKFGEHTVGEVMVPRSDIVFVEDAISFSDLQKLLTQKPHTRIPVCKETLDHVRGFIHVKDLIAYLSTGNPFSIEKIVRKALFVPPSMPLSDVLVQMKNSHTHMAIVVDEYGGTCGLLTMEDLVEEIVGELHDEHDDGLGDAFIHVISKNVFEASARVTIEELKEKTRANIKESDVEYETVGGMIVSFLGRVPSKGEVIKHPSGLEFEITDADSRRVRRVIIRKIARRKKPTPNALPEAAASADAKKN